MVGQILPNNNESATEIFPQKFWDLNTPLIWYLIFSSGNLECIAGASANSHT
jgi:TATA-box binding protein (TBP) (component of TFIID and TFIIIB)